MLLRLKCNRLRVWTGTGRDRMPLQADFKPHLLNLHVLRPYPTFKLSSVTLAQHYAKFRRIGFTAGWLQPSRGRDRWPKQWTARRNFINEPNFQI